MAKCKRASVLSLSPLLCRSLPLREIFRMGPRSDRDYRGKGEARELYALCYLSSRLLPVRHIPPFHHRSGVKRGGLCRIPAMHCHTASFSSGWPHTGSGKRRQASEPPASGLGILGSGRTRGRWSIESQGFCMWRPFEMTQALRLRSRVATWTGASTTKYTYTKPSLTPNSFTEF